MQINEYYEYYGDRIFSWIKVIVLVALIGLAYYFISNSKQSKYEKRIEKMAEMDSEIGGKIKNITPLDVIHRGSNGTKREKVKYKIDYYFELNHIKYDGYEILPINEDFEEIISKLKSLSERDTILIVYKSAKPNKNMLGIK